MCGFTEFLRNFTPTHNAPFYAIDVCKKCVGVWCSYLFIIWFAFISYKLFVQVLSHIPFLHLDREATEKRVHAHKYKNVAWIFSRRKQFNPWWCIFIFLFCFTPRPPPPAINSSWPSPSRKMNIERKIAQRMTSQMPRCNHIPNYSSLICQSWRHRERSK